MGLARVRAGRQILLGLKCPIIDEWAQAGPLGTITGLSVQLPPVLSVTFVFHKHRQAQDYVCMYYK
jgi:hypothetical protein